MQARAQRLENAVNVQQLVASVEAGTKRRIGEVLEDTDLEAEFLRYINFLEMYSETEIFVGDVEKDARYFVCCYVT